MFLQLFILILHGCEQFEKLFMHVGIEALCESRIQPFKADQLLHIRLE